MWKVVNDKEIKANRLLTNETKPREEYKKWTAWRRKLILLDNKLVWRGITYDWTYPARLVEYFSKPAYKKVKDKKTGEIKMVATDYPTFEAFRVQHKIPKTTWDNWVRDYPEVREAVAIVNDIKKNSLIVNWLNWNFNAQFAKFVGMNDLGMAEKVENKNTNEISDDQTKSMVREYLNDIKEWEVLDLN